MVHYISGPLLAEMSCSEFSSPNFGSSLTEVIATVLDNEVSMKPFLTIYN